MTEPSRPRRSGSLTCILSRENALPMIYWARRSIASRCSGHTQRLRGTLKPECTQPRSIRARSGGSRTLVEEKRDHAGPGQLFQRLEADIGSRGRGIEKTGTYQQAVREQHVQVRGVEVEVFLPPCGIWMVMTMPGIPPGKPRVVCMNSSRHWWAMRQRSLSRLRS